MLALSPSALLVKTRGSFYTFLAMSKGRKGVHIDKVLLLLSHLVSVVRLFGDPWTVARQASLSVGFPRQESWSGLPFPPSGDHPNPGMEPCLSCIIVGFFTTEPPGKPQRRLFSSVQFSRSVVSNSSRPHESQHARPPCPSQLLESTQTHAHQVSDAIQPSHPLSSPSPPAPNPSQHQGLFQ